MTTLTVLIPRHNDPKLLIRILEGRLEASHVTKHLSLDPHQCECRYLLGVSKSRAYDSEATITGIQQNFKDLTCSEKSGKTCSNLFPARAYKTQSFERHYPEWKALRHP